MGLDWQTLNPSPGLSRGLICRVAEYLGSGVATSSHRSWQNLGAPHSANKKYLPGRQRRSARRGSGRRGGGRLGAAAAPAVAAGRVQPAGVHPAIEALGGFGVDVALADQAAEGGLDMRRRAAKPVVKVEMAEGGVQSSRQSSLTTRRPSQTHSGLPAGPVSRREASANSSIFFWLSLAFFSAGGFFSAGAPLPLPWANAAPAVRLKASTQNAHQKRRHDINGFVPLVLMKPNRPLRYPLTPD